jgi:hypothetical protein
LPNESILSGPTPASEFLLFQTEDGRTAIQVRLENESLWLTQAQMAELFQTTPQNMTLHIQSIYEEGELAPDATCKDYLQVRPEGGRQVQRLLKHYNLEMVIAVGYRVRSHRGTQFRQWATERLREYLVKGFVLDDDRLKAGRGLGADYFDELLERIRAIRASERRFYQKITDIYSTSVDYDRNDATTRDFFATVQNKLHWAIHGHTAAEVIAARADGAKPNMGLTTWKNAPDGPIRRPDSEVAKNYLTREEISDLNLLVDQYLSFAESQARRRIPMTMAEWQTKLNGFVELNGRDVLTHAGKISAETAKDLANREYDKFDAERRRIETTEPTSDFDKFVEQVKASSIPPPGTANN